MYCYFLKGSAPGKQLSSLLCSSSGYGPNEGMCEHSNRAIGSVKCEGFFDQVMITDRKQSPDSGHPKSQIVFITESKICSWSPWGVRHKVTPTDRSSVVKWLWLWTVHATWMCLRSYSKSCASQQDCGANYSLIHTSLTHFIKSVHLKSGKDCKLWQTDGKRNYFFSPCLICTVVTRRTSSR